MRRVFTSGLTVSTFVRVWIIKSAEISIAFTSTLPTREEVFDWLIHKRPDLNYFPAWQDNLTKHVETTCEWFVQSLNFQAWLDNNPGTLVCWGISKWPDFAGLRSRQLTRPGGGGKTVLSLVYTYPCGMEVS